VGIASDGGGRERLEQAMRHLLWVTSLLLCANIPALSQNEKQEEKAAECPSGSPEAFAAVTKILSNAPSCAAAAAKFSQCGWGSSADTEFASIVVKKCESSFIGQASAAGRKRYREEMELCSYRYARQEGTMWMAVASGCQVNVAKHFAAEPAGLNQPAPTASFDCGKAQTAMEKAICSDIRLGHADMVLSRVYTDRLRVPEKDRAVLIENQKRWRQGVAAKCGVTPAVKGLLSPKSMNCLRNEFELRFTALDSCVGEIEDCLPPLGNTTRTEARASFDCGKASTPLENVICADADVGQADIRLAHAYRAADQAMSRQHRELVESQRQWLGRVSEYCPLGDAGGIPDMTARLCVRDRFESRTSQLQACSKKETEERLACLNDFRFERK
jgi:uncharacterized protein